MMSRQFELLNVKVETDPNLKRENKRGEVQHLTWRSGAGEGDPESQAGCSFRQVRSRAVTAST